MSEGSVIHLEVETGPEKGRRITVPDAGARLGRSSQNDIELTDPSISRFQCRVFFKPDQSLWVSDLGSTNQTLLNGQPILETELRVGDGIEMGETILRVVRDRMRGEAAPAPESAPSAAAGPVDLGFSPPPLADGGGVRGKRSGMRALPWLVLLVCLGAIAAAVLTRRPGQNTAGGAAAPAGRLTPLDITYEKVRANTANIFRYALTLRGRTLSAQVDSLVENRHVRRDKQVEVDVLGRLAGDLERLGIESLEPAYQGVLPDVYESTDLTLVLNGRAHRVKVLNRVEPDAFKRAREIVEEFARNELGLAAVSLPPEKLLELGRDTVQLGQQLFAEREVRYENLFRAIKAFEEAQWYVESLEPKPDYYASAVSGLEECKRALQERYEGYRFQADRAVKLRDWPAAAQNLRIICDLIPERSDDRHAQAAKMLLDVERRMDR